MNKITIGISVYIGVCSISHEGDSIEFVCASKEEATEIFINMVRQESKNTAKQETKI